MKKAARKDAEVTDAGVPIIIVDRDAVDWDNLEPGLAWWTKEAGAPEGTMRLTFVCPGGCGDLGGCRAAKKKPGMNPSWEWNGDTIKPTLRPSILSPRDHGGCGWHGYLTNGVFKVIEGEKNQCRGPRA